MMNAITTIFGIVVGLSLLAVLAAGGYKAFNQGLDLFGTLEPHVATITMIASMVAVFCATVVANGFKWKGRLEREGQLRAEKADLYERLALIWGAKLHPQDRAFDQAAEAEIRKLARLLTLRGSSKVIKAFGVLHKLERETGTQSQEVRAQMAKGLLEMRRDLGRVGLEPSERELLDVLQAESPRSSDPVPSSMAPPHVSLSQGV